MLLVLILVIVILILKNYLLYNQHDKYERENISKIVYIQSLKLCPHLYNCNAHEKDAPLKTCTSDGLFSFFTRAVRLQILLDKNKDKAIKCNCINISLYEKKCKVHGSGHYQ